MNVQHTNPVLPVLQTWAEEATGVTAVALQQYLLAVPFLKVGKVKAVLLTLKSIFI